MDKEKLQIHFVYCVVILVTLIILIATDRWTDKADFTVYLSNAATMTSLVLALVAIFYSFIANDGLSKSLGNISTVSNEVRESKEQIARYVDQTTSSANQAQANTDAMKAFSRDVNATLQQLDTALVAVTSRTDALNAAVSAIPTRLDLLESNVIGAAKLLGEKVQPPARSGSVEEPRAELVENFLNYSSLICNLFTYACVLAHRTNRPLSIDTFCNTVESQIPSWLSGFTSCMNATDLITYERVEGKEREYKFTMVHEVLQQRTKAYFIEYLQKQTRDPELAPKWLEKLKKVEALFES